MGETPWKFESSWPHQGSVRVTIPRIWVPSMTGATTLYLVCGKIASGKSTLAAKLAERPGTLLVSEDHWNAALFGPELRTIEDYGRLSARLTAAMQPHLVSILRLGLSIVLDFHANTVRRRAWLRSLIDAADVAHELHWLDVPDAVCLERLRARNAAARHPFQVSEAEFAQFTACFVPPSPNEGFHVIRHLA